MIWTLALVWYSLWWASVAVVARAYDELLFKDLFRCLWKCWFLPIVIPFAAWDIYSTCIIWKRP